MDLIHPRGSLHTIGQGVCVITSYERLVGPHAARKITPRPKRVPPPPSPALRLPTYRTYHMEDTINLWLPNINSASKLDQNLAICLKGFCIRQGKTNGDGTRMTRGEDLNEEFFSFSTLRLSQRILLFPWHRLCRVKIDMQKPIVVLHLENNLATAVNNKFDHDPELRHK